MTSETIYGFRNDGLIEGEHYEFGGYSGIADRPEINPTGDWESHLPVAEKQTGETVFFDSRNCSNYGTLNALETLAKFRGFADFPHNCSERYSGVMTGTSLEGNDPHKVIELIRQTAGVIPEEVLPFDHTVHSWSDYYSPDPMTLPYIRLGERVLTKFTISHEWVFNDRGLTDPVADKQSKLQAALKRGTVAVSVFAWEKRGDLYKKNRKQRDNHWLQLISCVPGKSWRVFDHYDQFIKDLEWNYNFECAKIYYLEPRAASPSWLQAKLDSLFKALADLLVRLTTPEVRIDLPKPPDVPVAPPVAPVVPPAPRPTGIDYGPRASLVKALIQVESTGVDTAVGDKHLTDWAYGPLQVRKPVCTDVNRVYGTSLTPKMMLGQRQLSIDTFYKYMNIYVTLKRLGRAPTDEDRARVWNGGPSACFAGTKMHTATTGYWAKVKKRLV